MTDFSQLWEGFSRREKLRTSWLAEHLGPELEAMAASSRSTVLGASCSEGGSVGCTSGSFTYRLASASVSFRRAHTSRSWQRRWCTDALIHKRSNTGTFTRRAGWGGCLRTGHSADSLVAYNYLGVRTRRLFSPVLTFVVACTRGVAAARGVHHTCLRTSTRANVYNRPTKP